MDLFKGGKWKKYHLLLEEKELWTSLPETQRLSEPNLWGFLDKYQKVILKPLSGCGGRGILRVAITDEKQYEVHVKNRKELFSDRKAAFDYIKLSKRPRTYLVQRYIDLAQINGCPYDLRVVVQRRRGASWEVTGIYAKVARQGYITTNLARKGKVLPLSTALVLSDLKHIPLQSMLEEINRIALLTSHQLSQNYTNHHIWGLDMGIDSKGHVWIIEANPVPHYNGFKKLKDKSMYHKIKSYIQYNLHKEAE